MNRQAISFVPTFAAYNMGPAAAQPKQPVAFTTTRTGKDRISSPSKIEAMHYDDKAKSIKVFCSDGKLRECRVERLPSIEHGRVLWRKLQELGAAKAEVTFTAAGGFSPDRWFYTAE